MISNVQQADNSLTVTLSDGTVIRSRYHVCGLCTSVDTWIVGDKDPENGTADPRRRTVRGFAWNRGGGRDRVDQVTTFTHVLDKEEAP